MKKTRTKLNTTLSVIDIDAINDVRKIMQNIKVHPEGIKWMVNKAIFRVIKVNNINNRAANIVKQEMLSIGGEVAVSREILDFKQGCSDILIMGTLKQYSLLSNKLKMQPFGLPELGEEIFESLTNFDAGCRFKLRCGRHLLDLSRKTHIMGILNFTPNSFSDGGKFNTIDAAIAHAQKMVSEGADIIDVGGESSRPGAKPVALKEELRRVIPVIKKIAKRVKVPISIDTYKSRVAEEALDNGAMIVNDISALRLDRSMVKVVAKYNVPVVLMHMQGLPGNMQKNPRYKDVVNDIIDFFKERIAFCNSREIKPENIIVDPGIGFGKRTEHNLEIIKRLKEFKILGKPVLLGTSRKSFIGNVLNADIRQREEGTLASSVIGMLNGANILRVHDVKKTVMVQRVTEAIQKGSKYVQNF